MYVVNARFIGELPVTTRCKSLSEALDALHSAVQIAERVFQRVDWSTSDNLIVVEVIHRNELVQEITMYKE